MAEELNENDKNILLSAEVDTYNVFENIRRVIFNNFLNLLARPPAVKRVEELNDKLREFSEDSDNSVQSVMFNINRIISDITIDNENIDTQQLRYDTFYDLRKFLAKWRKLLEDVRDEVLVANEETDKYFLLEETVWLLNRAVEQINIVDVKASLLQYEIAITTPGIIEGSGVEDLIATDSGKSGPAEIVDDSEIPTSNILSITFSSLFVLLFLIVLFFELSR